MERIITLTTDFGLKDPYQGAMKGSILSINPDAKITDITHLVPPGAIFEGAFILKEAYSFFPNGTIHVAVVDPGVGGERKPILVETENYFFVGPDNGLLSLALDREKIQRVVLLEEKKYFRNSVSSTFHGRDIFGPVAAHLSMGSDAALFGPAMKEAKRIEMPPPRKTDSAISGKVIYIDSFGNLITNIRSGDVADGSFVVVEVKGLTLNGLKKTYSSVETGLPLALIGSTNFLEIAVNGGMASKALNIAVGEEVVVRPVKK